MRPLLLDLFCGAGGAAMGYHRAGFDVIGVDINPQPHYPFTFWQTDAFTDCIPYPPPAAIHASPPCQAYSSATRNDIEYPDLVADTRRLLESTGLPYVIENVPGAPLNDPTVLCGSMFGMRRIRRHRLFETNFPLSVPSPCQHDSQRDVMNVTGHGEQGNTRRTGAHWGADARREAMGIDWMTRDELSQSIPPAYTEYIGTQLQTESTTT